MQSNWLLYSKFPSCDYSNTEYGYLWNFDRQEIAIMIDISIFYLVIFAEFLQDLKDLFKNKDHKTSEGNVRIDSKEHNFDEEKLYHYQTVLMLLNIGAIYFIKDDGYQGLYKGQYMILGFDIAIPLVLFLSQWVVKMDESGIRNPIYHLLLIIKLIAVFSYWMYLLSAGNLEEYTLVEINAMEKPPVKFFAHIIMLFLVVNEFCALPSTFIFFKFNDMFREYDKQS